MVGEHDCPLTESAHITNGGSVGTMPTARPELPYQCISQAKSHDETGGLSRCAVMGIIYNVTYNMYTQYENYIACSLVAYISSINYSLWMSMLF